MNVYNRRRFLSLFKLSISALISLIFFNYTPLVIKIFLEGKLENEVKIISATIALLFLAFAADRFGKSLDKIKDQENKSFRIKGIRKINGKG